MFTTLPTPAARVTTLDPLHPGGDDRPFAATRVDSRPGWCATTRNTATFVPRSPDRRGTSRAEWAMTSMEQRMATTFGLDGDGAWQRHANPWSVYTRIPGPAGLVA